ncbi:MAG: hypothetical protein R6U93_07600 [Dehalococcoidia bacterium]
MRLSKKVLVIIGVIVFAIVIGFLVSNYLQTNAEYRQLQDRLDQAKARLPSLITQKQDLDSQLMQAESKLASSTAKFPRSPESIEYGDDLFKTAAQFRVQIVRLTASGPTDKTVGTTTYSVASFLVIVEGEVKDILDFIHALRTPGDFQLPWSAEVKGVNIDYSGIASLNIDIYGYKG